MISGLNSAAEDPDFLETALDAEEDEAAAPLALETVGATPIVDSGFFAMGGFSTAASEEARRDRGSEEGAVETVVVANADDDDAAADEDDAE